MALLVATACCAACRASPDDAVAPGACIAPLQVLADFPIGVAVPAGDARNSLLASPERQGLVRTHFDSITAENIMKMAYLHPRRNEYDFAQADLLLAWAREHGIAVHGHTLLWHQQAPDWLTTFEGDARELQQVLDDHVRTVAGHFAPAVSSWDVVNEAFTDDSPSDYRDTAWYRKIGPGYIEHAFRAAREAAPEALLYYNDYDISGKQGTHKLDRILAMVDDFQARGVPIDGIGFQMHVDVGIPSADAIAAAFRAVASRGLYVRISELDVSVNSSEKLSRLTSDIADLQRKRYAEIARIYQESVPPPLRGGITVWGITDGDSWIPGFRERADWPLLFTADFQDKPALAGLAEGLATASPAPARASPRVK